MNHAHAQDLIARYLDGALEPDEAQALGAHLEECAACREQVAALRVTLGALAGLGRTPAPPDLLRRVQRQIRRRSRGAYYADPLPWRIPFEWLSFLLIIGLWVVYWVLSGPRDATPRVDPSSPPGAPGDPPATSPRPPSRTP